MRIRIPCPNCQKVLKIPAEHAGKKGKCPQCASVFRIPKLPSGAKLASEKSKLPASDLEPVKPPKVASSTPEPASPSDDDFLGDLNLSEFDDVPNQSSRKPKKSTSEPADDTYALSASADDPFGGDAFDDGYGENLPQLNPIRPKKKKRKKNSSSLPPPPPKRSGWQDAMIFVFGIALVPLAITIFSTEVTFYERLQQTFGDDLDEAIARVEGSSDPDAAFEQLLDDVHGHKLVGAHLGYDTYIHWLYALISAGVFLGLLIYLGNKEVSAGELLMYGIATGTVGIILLLGFQWVAFLTQGFWVRGRGVVILLFYLVKFIGFSYSCALNPENGFFLSFFGFTCGVGLCEEIVKAIPVWMYLQSEKPTWRGTLMLGLASGIGFGVSEGIHYSSAHYNGYAEGMIYLVRFASCVSLHAIWAGIVAMLMFKHEANAVAGDDSDLLMFVINYLLAVMVLHGLYDTLLKKDMAIWALVIAALSIGWLGMLFYRGRRIYEDEYALA